MRELNIEFMESRKISLQTNRNFKVNFLKDKNMPTVILDMLEIGIT